MQKVNFLFKLIEIILGLICLGYHTSGFLNVDFVQTHYTYCCIFGGFTLMAMYGCLAICLQESESVHPWWEGGINLLAAVCFIAVSVDSMFHAEKDFYLTYLISRQDEHDEEEEPHPFFKYSKAQSIAALYCGCLFLLHSIIAFDFALHQQRRNDNDVTMDDANSDNSEDSKIELYVCGKAVHKRLEKYDWFKKLN